MWEIKIVVAAFYIRYMLSVQDVQVSDAQKLRFFLQQPNLVRTIFRFPRRRNNAQNIFFFFWGGTDYGTRTNADVQATKLKVTSKHNDVAVFGKALLSPIDW